MPKAKTKKGVAKRFKLTKKGKVKRKKAGRGHLLSKKSRKTKRGLKKAALLSGKAGRIIKRMLPYG